MGPRWVESGAHERPLPVGYGSLFSGLWKGRGRGRERKKGRERRRERSMNAHTHKIILICICINIQTPLGAPVYPCALTEVKTPLDPQYCNYRTVWMGWVVCFWLFVCLFVFVYWTQGSFTWKEELLLLSYCLQVSLWRAFFLINGWCEGPGHCVCCHPWASCTEPCIKSGWRSHNVQVSKQRSSLASASVPDSWLLPWDPSVIGYD